MTTADVARSTVERAAALDALRPLLHGDPRGVATAASALCDEAIATGDAPGVSRALALRGRAHRSLGEIEQAELDLRRALDAARGPDADDLAADAHLGLAGVLSFAGRHDDAGAHLDEAERLGSPRTIAYVALQRAVVAQRAGRVDDALASFDAALPVLLAMDARLDVALVRMNRAMMRVARGELDAAEADLVEAGRLFALEQHDFGVAQTYHGLGVVKLRRGALPAAIAALDDAVARFERLGHAALEVQVDRVEALLAAGLARDAAEQADRLARRFEEAGNRSLAAEAWVRCAQAARLAGDHVTAREHAVRARDVLAAQGDLGFGRLARLEVLRATDPLDAAAAADSRALADELAAAGDVVGAVGALALACRATVDADGDLDTAAALARSCSLQAARLGLVEGRLLAAHAAAHVAVARGDVRRARRHLRQGLDELTRQRATLGAADARAAVAGHAAELVALGLRSARGDGRAAALFEWIERSRAGHAVMGSSPVDGSADAADTATAAAAGELASLRRVAAALRAARAAGSDDAAALVDEQRRLEDGLRRRQLREVAAGGATTGRPVTTGELRAHLEGRGFVTVEEIDGSLVAVVVGPTRATVHDLGSAEAVVSAAAAATAARRALVDPRSPTGSRPARLALLRRAEEAVAHRFAPVLRGDGPLLLSLPPALHTVSWPSLAPLRGRPVALVPSAGWVVASPPERRGRTPDAPCVQVVAGPRLVHAADEARRVAARHAGASLLVGRAATVPAVLAGLQDADVSHVVAHGHIRRDNPAWSSLELDDGPLYLYELERLARTPAVVVLSACDSGGGVRTGDQVLGLSSCLLGRGTRSLVAAVCPLPDSEATVLLMEQLHTRLTGGDRGSSGTAALAALDRGEPGSDLDVHAGCLAAFGDG